MHALLRHLEDVGFAVAPGLVGSGLKPGGREVLTFIGPVDPLVELAQLAWPNAKLHDDIVAGIEQLPPLADRTQQLAVIADGYGLTALERRCLMYQMI